MRRLGVGSLARAAWVRAGATLTLFAVLLGATVSHAGAPAEVNSKHSVAPIVGYNPTYKVFFGGAYFFRDARTQLGTQAIMTLTGVYKLTVDVQRQLSQRIRLRWVPEYARGFDPYYGEGGETRVEDRVDLFGSLWGSEWSAEYRFDSGFSVAPLVEVRARTEDRVDEDASRRMIPEEQRWALGIEQAWDDRDNEDSPNRGWLQKLSLRAIPSIRNTYLIDGSLRRYQPLGALGFVLGIAASGGYSTGEPSYLYRFSLGGTDRLRGYLDNRFRGRSYYLHQAELRLPVWGLLSTAVFAAAGDVGDPGYTRPKWSYGVGLRLGLPPSYAAKVRIDLGFGRDQSGVFMDFGHAF